MRDLIKQIMCLGMADILNKQEKMASRNTVIAGDPAHSTEKYNSLFELQDVDMGGLKQFQVDGNSMSPCEIENGDNVLAEKIDYNNYTVNRGDFLIIKVDPTYYVNEKPNYYYKLRRAIMLVDKNWDENNIIDKLKSVEGGELIWLGSYQKKLKEKYNKARNHYRDCDLVLSCTFKNGVMSYSFHRKEYIEYKVVTIIKNNKNHDLVNVKSIA